MLIPAINKNPILEIHTSLFDSMDKVNSIDWNLVVQNKNIYAGMPYLRAIEKSLSNELGFRYIIFYNQEDIPVAEPSLNISILSTKV